MVAAWMLPHAVRVHERTRARLRRALLGAHAALRGAALLALARLMCTSAAFCEDNLRLLITLLHTRRAPPTPAHAPAARASAHRRPACCVRMRR
jgi:hypothetical protein